jgi:integrase
VIADLWTRPDPANPRKRIPTARHGRGARWAVRYAGPDGKERSRSFATKDAAVAWDAARRTDNGAGRALDPTAGRRTVGDYADRWLAAKAGLTPAARHWYSVAVRVHVRPRWGATSVTAVTRAAVNEWLAELAAGTATTTTRPGQGLSPGRVRGMYVVLHGILEHAVDDRAIAANPASGARLPKVRRGQVVPLTAAELARLHDALPAGRYRGGEQHHRLVLLTLAFSGLRFGELVALNVGDLAGRRLLVDDAETQVNGRRVHGETKTHAERSVSLPAAVAERLATLAAGRAAGEPLILAPKGGRWAYGTWKRALATACERAGLGHTRTHALRHTAASLAISAGADVKVLQHMLGHAQASMTLDTYGHLMGDRLDEVSDALESLVPAVPAIPHAAPSATAAQYGRLRAV